jgi:shikimate dehydrogenase
VTPPLRFALFGNPVAQSLSPLMHKAAFAAMGLAAGYETIRAGDAAEVIRIFRERDLAGASVTIPFKETVLPLLDEVDEEARRIGAINTIVRRGNRLAGYNTDASGLAFDLEVWCGIRGRRFAVLGAGGAARAAVHALLKAGGTPTVYNRTAATAKTLAGNLGCAWAPLAALGAAEADVLINTTPIGMFPKTGETPVEKALLSRFSFVMDTIYNPIRTRLLTEAAAAGCRTRTGAGMFVGQGAGQIRLWMDREPPLAIMRRTVLEKLGGNDAED